MPNDNHIDKPRYINKFATQNPVMCMQIYRKGLIWHFLTLKPPPPKNSKALLVAPLGEGGGQSLSKCWLGVRLVFPSVRNGFSL